MNMFLNLNLNVPPPLLTLKIPTDTMGNNRSAGQVLGVALIFIPDG